MRRRATSASCLAGFLASAVAALEHSFGGYQVSRCEHSLQSATRALRDGRGEEYVAAALLHDIGDELAPYTHGEMVAAILRPYVEPRICWIVKHHGVFQQFHYGRASGEDPDARERFRGHEWFDDCAEFCELEPPTTASTRHTNRCRSSTSSRSCAGSSPSPATWRIELRTPQGSGA